MNSRDLHSSCIALMWILMVPGQALFGQSVFHATVVAVTRVQQQALEEAFTDHVVFQIDPDLLHRFVRSHPQRSRLTLEIGDIHRWSMHLNENEMRTPGYRAEQSGPNGTVILPRSECMTYQGYLLGTTHDIRLNIESHRFWGYVTTASGMYFIEPLRQFDPSAPPDLFVVHEKAARRLSSQAQCSADDIEIDLQHLDPGDLSDRADDDCRKLEIATESDWEFYDNGQTLQDIQGCLNMVEGIYYSQFTMRFKIVYQHEWTTSSDPYTNDASGCLGFGELNEFNAYWATNFTHVRRDINVLFSEKGYNDGKVGCAYTGAFGDDQDNNTATTGAYCVVEWLDDFLVHTSADRMVCTAHEMGHIFGANHGTGIMTSTLDPGATSFSATSVSQMTVGMDHGSASPTTPDNDGRSTLRLRYLPAFAPDPYIAIAPWLTPNLSANEWWIDKPIVYSATGTVQVTATAKTLLKPGFSYVDPGDGPLIINIGACNINQ